MNYLIHQLLNAEEINLIKKKLEKCNQQDWEDGNKTAGSHASMVKNNLQLNRNSEASKKYSQIVNKKILTNQLIKSFSLPKRVHGIMFTKRQIICIMGDILTIHTCPLADQIYHLLFH